MGNIPVINWDKCVTQQVICCYYALPARIFRMVRIGLSVIVDFMEYRVRLIPFFFVLSLIGCASSAPVNNADSVANAAGLVSDVSEEQLDNAQDALPRPVNKQIAREHFIRGLNHLQAGRAQAAGESLNLALGSDPEHKRAQDLLWQMKASPEQYFSSDFITYRTRFGESLSGIAKRFFNDPYKFYMLARYNGITDPSRLEVGQMIKIPKQVLAPLIKEQEAGEEVTGKRRGNS